MYIGVRPKKNLENVKAFSGMYIDDLMEAANDIEVVKNEYMRKKDIFIKYGCAIKDKSIQQGKLTVKYVGKIYQGINEESIIANTEENLIKAIAIT